jgi:hypothetical protein
MAEESDNPDKGKKLPKDGLGDTTLGDPSHARETTRSKIALVYLYAFFGTILLAFLIGVFNHFEVKDYKDILLAVSGVL